MPEMLDKAVELFRSDENIKLIILEGSQVSGKPVDILSDHDINVYSSDFSKYIGSNEWIYDIGKPLIYQKPDFFIEGERIYSRLIVFYNRERVDISFWPMKYFEKIVNESRLPEQYRNGYRVLFDRGSVTGRLPEADRRGFSIEKPTRDEFLRTVNDIWYEAYAIAKYIRRGSLWFAKDVSTGPILEFLRQLIIWDICSRTEWGRNDIHLEGKDLDSFMDYEVSEKLKSIFNGYSDECARTGLTRTLDLASSLYEPLAERLDVKLPAERLVDLMKFISDILNKEDLEKWN